jgi:hypothetical protein
MHYTVDGSMVTMVLGQASSGPNSCATMAGLALQQKRLARLRPTVVHVSGEHLWHIDFRWMLLRDAIASCAQAAIGTVLRIHAREANDDHQDVLVVADDGHEWHWRRCRLRRYLLVGMSMSGNPENVCAVSMDAIRRYVHTQADVSLSWNMGTCLAVCNMACLTIECTFGLTRQQLEAVCVQYSVFVAAVESAFITVARKGLAVHVLVCATVALAADEASRFDSASTEKWVFDKNPALLMETVTALPIVDAVTWVPAVQVDADACGAFFKKVCEPALSATESGITLDAPTATVVLELSETSTVDVAAAVYAATWRRRKV